MVDESRTDKETRLWKEWKRTGADAPLSELLTSLTPIVERSVKQWSGSVVPDFILRARANNLIVEALNDWDPNISKMNTHLINRLQKLSRLVYENQNVARIPESRASKIGAYQSSFGELEDTLGREPSVGELADHMSWNVKEIERIQKDMRKEVPSSMLVSSPEFYSDTKDKVLLDYYYNTLAPQNQVVFESLTGYGGKEVLTPLQIARRAGLTVNEVEENKNKFVTELKTWKAFS